MSLAVAVVGSGPAGCYLAERLVRDAPDCRIAIIDRLPTPYGLVRGGVAPDHQSTKAVTRVFDRVFGRGTVAFFGDLEIGGAVRLDELRQLFDAVVIATGAAADRRLEVPGERLPGIVPSGAFVGWYNGHPDHAGTAPELSRVRAAAIIGNGNVALDVARILAKSPAELAASDMAPEVAAALAAAPLEEIHILGRRGPAEASFALQELGELGALARAEPRVSPGELPAPEGAPNPAIIAQLRDFARRPEGGGKPIAIRFHFHALPAGFTGADGVESARFLRPDGRTLTLAVELVVTCIGYRALPCCTLEPQGPAFANEDGRIAAGLYAVGWAKRGPSGTIATNRAESHAVAQRLIAETAPAGKPGPEGLARLLAERHIRIVDFAAWQRIDAAERAAAEAGRPRRKLTTRAALRAAATA